jgi:hypothetical protein
MSESRNFVVLTAAPERLAVSPGAHLSELVARGEDEDHRGDLRTGSERVGDCAVSPGSIRRGCWRGPRR